MFLDIWSVTQLSSLDVVFAAIMLCDVTGSVRADVQTIIRLFLSLSR